MSIRIGIGPGMANLDIAAYWRWVELCETSGIDSIWHSDQVMTPGLEPMAMLAALAARTERLRFGTNALVLPFRDPLSIARQCATIDALAPGRLIPVIGVGNEADPAWAATGRDPGIRGGQANEAITLIRRLLTDDSVTFSGQHYRFADARVFPRPARPIPIWIGGQSEAAIRRTALIGDGWLGSFAAPETAAQIVARIKAALVHTGRQIDDDHYGMVIPYRIGGPDDEPVVRFTRRIAAAGRTAGAPAVAAGSAGAIAALFRRHVAAGVAKFVAIPLAADAADLFSQTERLAAEILPEVEDRARK